MNIDCSFKNKQYYKKLQKKFKKYGNIYRLNFSGRPYIGDCSFLYRKLKPLSTEDFFNKYISYYNDDFSFKNHKGNNYFGRSIEQLTYLAKCYNELIISKYPNSNVTIQECYDDLINHIIIETYEGHFVEQYLIDLISKSSDDFIVESCTGDIDAKIGIDFIIKKHSNTKYARYIQIKPQSFFSNTNNKSLLHDRLYAFKKEKLLQEKIDKNGFIEYVIYDKNIFEKNGTVLIAEKNGKTKFKLSDLINNSGKPKFDIKKDFNYEIPGKQKKDGKDDK